MYSLYITVIVSLLVEFDFKFYLLISMAFSDISFSSLFSQEMGKID